MEQSDCVSGYSSEYVVKVFMQNINSSVVQLDQGKVLHQSVHRMWNEWSTAKICHHILSSYKESAVYTIENHF